MSDAYRAVVERAHGVLAEVMALHARYRNATTGEDWCLTCVAKDTTPELWPCPTVRLVRSYVNAEIKAANTVLRQNRAAVARLRQLNEGTD